MYNLLSKKYKYKRIIIPESYAANDLSLQYSKRLNKEKYYNTGYRKQKMKL